MRQFSNRYIFAFSTVMVVIVAVLLSLAATLLQPAQERNLETEKKKNMLESIRIPASRQNAVELYDRYIKESFVINTRGEILEDVDAFTVVLRAEQKKPAEQQSLPVFRAVTEEGGQLIILPLEGKGLWGPINGYISLRQDMNTVYGVTFDHKGETPGLGAEINTPEFENMFRDKKLFDDQTFVSVKVVKGGAGKDDVHGVDAISGGTITSRGLENMLYDCLIMYDDYLLKYRN